MGDIMKIALISVSNKGYDFSSMIIAPMLEAFNNGGNFKENMKNLRMKFTIHKFR